MHVGVPKEIKSGEHRVSMTPAGVRVRRRRGDISQDARDLNGNSPPCPRGLRDSPLHAGGCAG